MQTMIESNGFGMMTPIMAEQVKQMIATYPADWIIEAMRIAVKSNVLRMNYVTGILENWKREGFGYDSRKHHSDRSRPTNGRVSKGKTNGTIEQSAPQGAGDYEWYSQFGSDQT